MKSLLCSWGGAVNTPFIFESQFDAKWKKMRVAYVPNAKDFMNGSEKSKSLKEVVQRFEAQHKSVEIFDLYDRQSNFTVDFMTNKFDMIYVGGGMLGPLHRAVFETGFNELLNQLGSTDMYYVGSSAGAMICSETLQVAGWYPDEQEPDIATKTGLGWLPYEIFPHYQNNLKGSIKNNSAHPMIIMEDGSAVSIEGKELRFHNQARILI